MDETIQVPKHFEPRPHQQRAWNIIEHGDENHSRPDFFFLLWSRRAGKDTFSHERILYTGFSEPGNQHVYVGVDNVWIRDNIFNMYIEGRTFWDEYPEDIIEPKDTKREVWFRNNPPGLAPTRIKYVGLKNEKGVVGSGYRDWMISDTGLFPDGAFDYLFPIWQDKKAQGLRFQVGFNGTPRGRNQDLYTLLCQYTGEDDPLNFPGWHETPFGTCYVDLITIEDVQVPIRDKAGKPTGKYKALYSKEEIEELRLACIKSMGNDNWFRQEFYCDFLAVNAGLVYQAWEIVKEEGRYTKVNRDPNHPVFITFDLGSKGKFTDATSAIYWQSYAGVTKILDTYESRGKAFVECLADMSNNPLFRHVTFASLPWDVERGYTEKSALDEARERYKNITFEALKQTPAIRQDIEYAQLLMPNLWVDNSEGEDSLETDGNHSGGGWFAKCIEQYQYRRIENRDDWGKPVHDWSSHLMDCWRYVAMTIKAAEAGKFSLGSFKQKKTSYGSIFDEPKQTPAVSPIYMTEAERKVWYDRQQKQQSGFGGMDNSRGKRWSF